MSHTSSVEIILRLWRINKDQSNALSSACDNSRESRTIFNSRSIMSLDSCDFSKKILWTIRPKIQGLSFLKHLKKNNFYCETWLIKNRVEELHILDFSRLFQTYKYITKAHQKDTFIYSTWTRAHICKLSSPSDKTKVNNVSNISCSITVTFYHIFFYPLNSWGIQWHEKAM